VFAIWRAGSVPARSTIVSEGKAYVIVSITPVDEATERATLAEESARRTSTRQVS